MAWAAEPTMTQRRLEKRLVVCQNNGVVQSHKHWLARGCKLVAGNNNNNNNQPV